MHRMEKGVVILDIHIIFVETKKYISNRIMSYSSDPFLLMLLLGFVVLA
jgi:hypothetical protein